MRERRTVSDAPPAWQRALAAAAAATPDDAEALRDTTDAAEELAHSFDLPLHPDLGRATARLVGLLDSLGLEAVCETLLRRLVDRLAWEWLELRPTPRAASLDRIAVTLTGRGRFAAAATLLNVALELHAQHPGGDAAAATWANLAAVRLALGDTDGSARAAAEADERFQDTRFSRMRRGTSPRAREADLDLRLLVASLRATTARAQGRSEEADRHLAEVESVVRELVGLLGTEHPRSLSALVTLATAEFDAAVSHGDEGRRERAIDVLAVAAQKAAATAGARHPLTRDALGSLEAAERIAASDRTAHPSRRATGLLSAVRAWDSRADDGGPGAGTAPPMPPWEYEPAPVRRDLRFAVLGPLRVWRSGDLVPLEAPKLRALLVALLLPAPRPVPAGDLIAALWGSTPPRSADVTLKTYVLRLRESIGAPTVAATAGGFELRTSDLSIDLLLARDLIASAEQARASGDPEAARTHVEHALGLWNDDPLSDVPGEYAAARARELTEWHLELLRTRLELDLELGDHRRMVADLRPLTETHPTDERLARMLMLGLYLQGRRSEALAVFQRTRARLGADLGLEPGPELRLLHRR
ncbi:AfsR/SARP family transcriptional regulator, partial [Streptomyces longispororuber]|uniref:AfsR/SARP family transcriptional regulator n=1 Tax=Streptomyces longispororuber TaxID=68230 RepID=UPI00210AA56C